MMRKHWLPLVLALMLLAGCASPAAAPAAFATPDSPGNTATVLVATAPFSPYELVDGYMAMIDALYDADTALNSTIKYIAVDTSEITNLDRAAKDRLLKAAEKLGSIVLEDSMDGLRTKGYIHDDCFTDGIVFELKDQKLKNGVITVKATKWRAADGAVGCTYDIVKKDGYWTIVNTYDWWIS